MLSIGHVCSVSIDVQKIRWNLFNMQKTCNRSPQTDVYNFPVWIHFGWFLFCRCPPCFLNLPDCRNGWKLNKVRWNALTGNIDAVCLNNTNKHSLVHFCPLSQSQCNSVLYLKPLSRCDRGLRGVCPEDNQMEMVYLDTKWCSSTSNLNSFFITSISSL